MKKLLLLLTVSLTFLGRAVAQPEGDWLGYLRINAITLKIVFHIKTDGSGYKATMDSPDQGAHGLIFKQVIWNAPRLTMQMPEISGVYSGELKGDSLIGEWLQGNVMVPLNLVRDNGEATDPNPRPQLPQAPFNYVIKEVKVKNPIGNFELAGTLTIPKGKGPFPAVILVSGSGPHDRDGSMFGHKPFWVLAHELTRSGIAVLRYDDRGVGASKGKFRGAKTSDFANDARTMLNYVRTVPEVNPQRTGVIGHSEGGLIAWLLAQDSIPPAFVISLAGPGTAIDELMLLQTQMMAQDAGLSDEEVAKSVALNRELYQLVKSHDDSGALRTKVTAKLVDYKKSNGEDPKSVQALQEIGATTMTLVDPWFREFIRYDPVSLIQKITIPVFAVNGHLDRQVSANENLRSISDNLIVATLVRSRIQQYPGLNHLFQSAQTGNPNEYGKLRETFSPQVMEDIADWIFKTIP
jgi:uncharacterized protein